MINPEKITNYNLSIKELEAVLIFWIFAAGKNGTRAAKITNNIINDWRNINKTLSPFVMLMHYPYNKLVKFLAQHKTGCQSIKAKTLYQLCRAELNLKTCTVEDLEKIYGIGMKTARCFVMHSRKNAPYAGLDTHMLKHLKTLGYEVPKNTPTKKGYLSLEKIVLRLAKEQQLSPADYDLKIWNEYKVMT